MAKVAGRAKAGAKSRATRPPTTNPPQPSRTSRRNRKEAPEDPTSYLNSKSKLGKQLESKLIADPEETRKSRDELAKRATSKRANGTAYLDILYDAAGNETLQLEASDQEQDDAEDAAEDDAEDDAEDNAEDETDRASAGGEKRPLPDEDGPTEDPRPPKRQKTKRATDENSAPAGGMDDNIDVASPQRAPSRPSAPMNADERFLNNAIQQYESVHPRKRSLRRDHVQVVLPLLRRAQPPNSDRIQRFANIPAEEHGDQPDCYILSSIEAKRLLESNAAIEAPVFVPDGAREGLFTDSIRRPIEQLLRTWFLDGLEQANVKKSGKSPPGERLIQIAKLRRHFLHDDIERRYPWNLPDIANPRAEECKPLFVQSLNCNLLKDVARRVLDVTDNERCPPRCPTALSDSFGCSNPQHKLTHAEYHRFLEGWELWQGTVMLADPGAITPAHWDNWALGTWISCHEGEIGLVWRSHASEAERVDHLYENHKTRGRSLYKVLRPGEAVYMPSGTIHTVFRRPSGNQTLAFAGHILRRSAIGQWLEISMEEANWANSSEDEVLGVTYEFVIPPFARVLEEMLQQDNVRRVLACGDDFDEVLAMAGDLRGVGDQLRRKGFGPARDPPGVRSPPSSPIRPADL